MKDEKKTRLLLLAAGLLFLCLVLAVSLAFCAGGNKPRIGICLRQNQEQSEYTSLLKEQLKEAGYRVSTVSAENDQSRQTEQIGELIEKEYDLLVIEPVMVGVSGELAQQLQQAQIPAIFINYKPDEAALELWDRLSYVGCQEELHGVFQGELVLETAKKGDLNGDGTVSCLIITGPEDDRRAQLQAQGCIQALTDGNMNPDPVATLWGAWSLESGRKLCADALSQYGKDIEVIFCGNDTLAQGAAEAIDAGGWNVGKDLLVVGLGGTEEVQELVAAGQLTGTVAQDIQGQCQQVLAVAEKLLAGEEAENVYYVNCKPVVAAAETP